MQSQEGMKTPPEPTMSGEQIITNNDPREQQQVSSSQEYTEHPYEEGYTGLDTGEMWPRKGEKIRPRSAERHDPSGLLLLLVLVCALIAGAAFIGLILVWLTWLLLTALVIVGVTLAILNWRTVTIPMPTQTFSIVEHPQLVINDTVSSISIRRGENGVINVAPRKHVSGIGVTPENMQVNYDLRGSILHISTKIRWNLLQFGLRKIDLDITVPEACNVHVTNGSGRITAEGLSGEIQLVTGSGRIETHTLQGNIVLKTGSGRITGSDMNGQIVLITGSGRIDIQRTIMAGSSRFKTGSGSINFDGNIDPHGNYDLRTGSGSVQLSLASDASFRLRAKTGSGKVLNEFDGFTKLDEPQAILNVKTGSGSIHVHRL